MDVTETSSIPPGPKGSWLLGHLPDFKGDLLGFLTQCAQKHGDIVSLRLGTTPAVLLNHPDQIEQVLVSRHADFIKYRFFWRHVRRVFGKGLADQRGRSMAAAARADGAGVPPGAVGSLLRRDGLLRKSAFELLARWRRT